MLDIHIYERFLNDLEGLALFSSHDNSRLILDNVQNFTCVLIHCNPRSFH